MALVRVARDAEDVAGGLRVFRDALPRDATHLTAIISKLFAVSALLTELDTARLNPRYEPSFYRIKGEVALVLKSLQPTLDATFDMFGRSKDISYGMVWGDLRHRMEEDEGAGLLDRLHWYDGLLASCLAVLRGRPSADRAMFRQQIFELLDLQDSFADRFRPRGAARAGKLPPATHHRCAAPY